ncbi:MAG TPA: transporter [Dongiaceae bacterium]
MVLRAIPPTTLARLATLGSLIALGLSLAAADPARGGEIGHFTAPLADIRDYAMPAKPGFYFKEYDYYYHTNTFKDRHGDKVSNIDLPRGGRVHVDADVDIFVLAPTFMWVSKWEILGAHYGAYIIPTFGNSSVDASLTTIRDFGVHSDESSFGVGDMYVEPIWLGWTLKNWDFAVGYGFYAPIGQYNSGDTDNVGLGFWTNQFQGSVAWYPNENRGTALVAAVTYEINSKIEGQHLTPGQRLNVNLGADQMLPLGQSGFLLDVGVGLYGQWQITDDTGSDAVDPNVHDQVYGVGPQLGLTYLPWNAAATAKWQHEFEAENRFEGENFTMNFAVGF